MFLHYNSHQIVSSLKNQHELGFDVTEKKKGLSVFTKNHSEYFRLCVGAGHSETFVMDPVAYILIGVLLLSCKIH